MSRWDITGNNKMKKILSLLAVMALAIGVTVADDTVCKVNGSNVIASVRNPDITTSNTKAVVYVDLDSSATSETSVFIRVYDTAGVNVANGKCTIYKGYGSGSVTINVPSAGSYYAVISSANCGY